MLIDSNVLLDVFEDDPVWADWSETMLEDLAEESELFINPIVYAEISIGFRRIEELDAILEETELRILPLPKEALFLAGKAFLSYRRGGGTKAAPLPDFFIGAHAAVAQFRLLTRDPRRIRTHFPSVTLIHP